MANNAKPKKGGLGGGGLKSLFEKNGVEPATRAVAEEKTSDGEVIEQLKLSVLVANQYQPRQEFDADALADLAKSIAQNGVVNPIVVRKKGAKYEIVAGERRLRAAKLAKLATIPAIVRVMDDAAVMEIAVIENLQREDLDVIEEAKAYQLLMTELSLTQAEVAKRIGRDRSAIANTLRLLKLPADVQASLQAGELSMGQARALLGLKDDALISAFAARVIEQGLNVRQVEALVQQANNPVEPTAPVKTSNSPLFKAISTQLEEKFGTKVKINSNDAGKGKIEINYVDADELTRILTLLDVTID